MRTLAVFLSLISGGMISALIFLWLAAGEIYDYEDHFDFAMDAAKVDVVLCLAGGKNRISFATEIWLKIKKHNEGKAPVPMLFFSGVGPKAGLETLIEQGVSAETLAQLKKEEVIFENVSGNTFQNAKFFASFAKQKNWKRVLLVTAGYHMRRAQFILKKVLDSDILLMSQTLGTQHFDRNEWHQDAYAVRVTMMEYLKWLYYRYHY